MNFSAANKVTQQDIMTPASYNTEIEPESSSSVDGLK